MYRRKLRKISSPGNDRQQRESAITQRRPQIRVSSARISYERRYDNKCVLIYDVLRLFAMFSIPLLGLMPVGI